MPFASSLQKGNRQPTWKKGNRQPSWKKGNRQPSRPLRLNPHGGSPARTPKNSAGGGTWRREQGKVDGEGGSIASKALGEGEKAGEGGLPSGTQELHNHSDQPEALPQVWPSGLSRTQGGCSGLGKKLPLPHKSIGCVRPLLLLLLPPQTSQLQRASRMLSRNGALMLVICI